jgi:hypothetical protein
VRGETYSMKNFMVAVVQPRESLSWRWRDARPR